MSLELMGKVWKDKRTSGSERLVLLALADQANDEGYCWPSLATIADRVNVSRRQVLYLLDSLEEHGFVRRERRENKSGGQTSNGYWVTVDEGVQPIAQGGEADCTGECSPLHGGVQSTAPKSLTNPVVNQSLSGAGEVHPLERWFERFGLMLTANDAAALKELRDLGVIEADLDAAWVWWRSNMSKPFRSVAQFSGSVKTARLARVQAAQPVNPKRAPAQQMGGMATLASKGEGPRPGESHAAWLERVQREALEGLSEEDRAWLLEVQRGRSGNVGVAASVA